MNETQQFMCYLLTSQYGAEWEKIKGELAEGQDLIARMQDKETTLVKYCTYFESTKKIYNGLSKGQQAVFLYFLAMREEQLTQEGMENEEVEFNLRMLAYVFLPFFATNNY